MSGLRDLRAIFFDLDGVLVDSSIAIPRSINFALRRQGLAARPEECLHSFIGMPLLRAFGELLASQGADPGLAPACVESYRERYRERCLDETTLMPGIEATVRRLGGRHALAVVTAKPAAFAQPILEKLGIADCFVDVFGPSLARDRQEEKAETVRRAMAALGIGARCGGAPAAMVGDRHYDVAAGRATGLVTVGVTWGIGSVSELRRAGADHIVGSPEELARLFRGGW